MLLKLNLGIKSTSKDDYFISRIEAAIEELMSRGVDVNLGASADKMLLADFVAWDHRKIETGAPMPKNIEIRIINRKAKGRCG